jgi:hypothetical protein
MSVGRIASEPSMSYSLPFLLRGSDGGDATLARTDDQDMHLTEGYYEIIGTVKDDKSVKALTSIELGPKLG